MLMPNYLTKDEVRRKLRLLAFAKATIEAWLVGYVEGHLFADKTYVAEFVAYLGTLPEIELTYYCDAQRHLVCIPYSKENLHQMAEALGINRGWFDRDHYDIPLLRLQEIRKQCVKVDSRMIIKIIMAGRTERAVVRGKKLMDGQPKEKHERNKTIRRMGQDAPV